MGNTTESTGIESTITDNVSEKIIIKWDGERFALIKQNKNSDSPVVIILNYKEMLDIVSFLILCEDK